MDDDNEFAIYEFVQNDEGSYVHYMDPYYKKELWLEVPDFFISYPGNQIQDELDFSVKVMAFEVNEFCWNFFIMP